MKTEKEPATLLILDDRKDVRVALGRYLGLFFERVLLAETPSEAETHLEESRPDYLLCDFWLGEEFPPATAFIPGWREKYPSLKRVALMTGTKASSVGPCPGVDGIFRKPVDKAKLIQLLRGEL